MIQTGCEKFQFRSPQQLPFEAGIIISQNQCHRATGSAMFWYYFAYSLFILGASLGIIGNGSEISLWFVSMGWVLETTLVLLVGLRSPKLPNMFLPWARKIPQIAALLTFPVMFYYRLKADMTVYKLSLALCLLFWSLSLVTTPAKIQNDQEKK